MVVSDGWLEMFNKVLTHVKIAKVLKFQVKSGLTLKYCVIANRTMLAAHTLERMLDGASCIMLFRILTIYRWRILRKAVICGYTACSRTIGKESVVSRHRCP